MIPEGSGESGGENRFPVRLLGRSNSFRAVACGLAVHLSIVMAIAALYYFVPRDMQLALALDHQSPQFTDFWTTTFVHGITLGDSHLLSNVAGFTPLAFYTWLIYSLSDAETTYWKALLMMLVPGAILINASSYIFYTHILEMSLEYGWGFSSVVGQLTGFLLISIVSIFAILLWTAVRDDGFSLRRWIWSNWGLALLAVLSIPLVLGIFYGLVLVDFSAESGNFANIFGHGVAIILGMFLALWYSPQLNILPENVSEPELDFALPS